MPHWNDLTGNRQPLSDSAPLVPAKLVADQDIARIHNDGNAWSWNHLATVVAGDDPALALANFMADYWNRQNQYMLINSLTGVFGAASMAGNLLAIQSESVAAQTASTRLNGATFVDATQRLGDRGDRLVAVATACGRASSSNDASRNLPSAAGAGKKTKNRNRHTKNK